MKHLCGWKKTRCTQFSLRLNICFLQNFRLSLNIITILLDYFSLDFFSPYWPNSDRSTETRCAFINSHLFCSQTHRATAQMAVNSLVHQPLWKLSPNNIHTHAHASCPHFTACPSRLLFPCPLSTSRVLTSLFTLYFLPPSSLFMPVIFSTMPSRLMSDGSFISQLFSVFILSPAGNIAQSQALCGECGGLWVYN